MVNEVRDGVVVGGQCHGVADIRDDVVVEVVAIGVELVDHPVIEADMLWRARAQQRVHPKGPAR